MLIYAAKRLLLAIPTLAIVAVAVFAMLHLLPGDPAQLMLGDMESPEALARLHAELGLDRPLTVQFAMWIARVLHGDLGVSIVQQRPVLDMLLGSFAVTASIVVPAVVIAALLAIPLGMLAAWKQNTKVDAALMTLAIVFLSIPSFWLGLLFLMFFGLKLDLFPVVGYVSPLENFREGISYLIMPVMSLALIETGVIVRMARASTIEVLRLEYITHARAKGLAETTVALRHALKNTLAPTWTVIGLTLGSLLGGAVVTETVFTIPGIGRLLVDSIFARDYPVVQGALLFITAIYVGVNLLIDLSYPLFDPRVRLS
ncbi:MAG: ABC transporter permease [Rudaea sp.]|uniref:ABC transporter permease n=1 Tax=unclassified Rudaea TaxID=2627037 RepID=UPI0010F62F2E|nr:MULTISPECIES: ABC transporter permease [unclassified Rudaea]MBN8886135.1 ABC transporter permease [Rudaea sp.]MBR0345225.1 ABC transporter permease [Rudaea sp.]